MAKGLDIRRRIKSVKSTKSITKAMQMVAASKMRKAQEQALKTRNYANKSLEILATVSEKVGNFPHYLLTKTDGARHLIVLITSNKGLCGSLNANILRKMLEFIENKSSPVARAGMISKDETVFDFVTVGKKGRDTLFRLDKKVAADFSDIVDSPSGLNILPLTRYLLEEYKAKKYDRIYLIYSHFVSVLSQKSVVKRLVPLGGDVMDSLREILSKKETVTTHHEPYEYLFEPSPQKVLEDLLPRFVEIQIFQALLESYASEQSARMMAMQNATEAAGDLVDDLVLTYNKARQAGITQEISEIVGGVEAQKR